MNTYLRLTKKGVAYFEAKLHLKINPNGSVIRQVAQVKPDRKQRKIAVNIAKAIERILMPYLQDNNMTLR